MEIYEYTAQVMPRRKDVKLSQQLLADGEWMNTGLYRKNREGNIVVIPYLDFGKVLRYEENYYYRVYLVRKDASFVRSAFRRYFRENGLDEYIEPLKAAELEDKGEVTREEPFSKEEMAAIRQHDKQALRERRDSAGE